MGKTLKNNHNGLNNDLMNKFLSPQFIQFYFDFISLILGYLIYFWIKFESDFFYNPVKPDLFQTFIPMVIIIVSWLTIFWFSGLYKNWYVRSPFDEFFSVLRITFFGSFILFLLIFFDSPRSPRLLFLIYFAILTVTVGIGRLSARYIHKKLRINKRYVIDALLIGTTEDTHEFSKKINQSPAWGYKIIGSVNINHNSNGNERDKSRTPIFGDINQLETILHEHRPSEVLIITEESDRSVYMNIANLCAENGISVKIIPDLYDIFTGSARTLPIYGIPLIEINTQLMKPWEASIKRIIDIFISLIVIIFGLPVWIIVALIILIESKGGVFYMQP